MEAKKRYYKIIGLNHGNFPYKLGLNDLESNGEKFNSNNNSCGPGGLYFCEIEDIFWWTDRGNKVCEITLPEDAQLVQVSSKFKADKIFIERIFHADIRELIRLGAHARGEYGKLLLWKIGRKDLETVKFLIERGADAEARQIAFSRAVKNNDLEAAKILLKSLCVYSIRYGIERVDVNRIGVRPKSLVAFNTLFGFVEDGNLEMVKFLVGARMGIHVCDELLLRRAVEKNHFEMVKFLVESGADVQFIKTSDLDQVKRNGQLGMLKYIISQHRSRWRRIKMHIRYRV